VETGHRAYFREIEEIKGKRGETFLIYAKGEAQIKDVLGEGEGESSSNVNMSSVFHRILAYLRILNTPET
jgi:hypothetical protein